MTDSHASEDSPGVEARLVDATATGTPAARNTDSSGTTGAPPTDSSRGRHGVAPSADVAPELHEVTDA